MSLRRISCQEMRWTGVVRGRLTPAASPQACKQGPSARFAGWPAGTAEKPKRRALHGLFGELKQVSRRRVTGAQARSDTGWRAVRGGYV